MSTPILHIRLFGSLELACGDKPLPALPSAKARSLLAYLILHRDHPIPRNRLAGMFWPDRPDARARRALSQALWQIRSILHQIQDDPSGRLKTERESITFTLHPQDRLDVAEFESGIQKARSKEWSDVSRLQLFTSCVQLYQGDFFQECYDDWALLKRERLRELYLGALEQLIALHKQRGNYEHALVYAQQLAAADPLREETHRELMRLYHLLNRPQAALEQFAALRRLLAQELDIAPAAATAALYHEISAALDESTAPHLPIAPPPPILRDLAHLPLIGREKERDLLLDALQAAARGHSGLALIEGSAGVGKTRLLTEIAASATWRGFQVGMGKAEPATAPAPYNLLTQALRDLLTPLRLSQLATLVEPPYLGAVAHLLPAVAASLPDLPRASGLPPDQQREQLWEGLARCVAALAAIAPTLLALEDLHWADDASLVALQNTVQRMQGNRVLIVVTYRPAEAWERPRVRETLVALDRLDPVNRISLTPLTAGQADALVQRALQVDELSAAFAARLWTETQGNPLFLIETIKALLEQGDLVHLPDGSWGLPGADLLSVSTSIRELVVERLARLSPARRAALELAAVLGEDADFPILAHAADVTLLNLIDHLMALSQHGFLTERGDGYRFEHDLVWEIVYQSIPPQRRRELHRRAGETLEALRPDRAESLALHLDRGGQREKAIVYILQAAEQAQTVYDYEAALAHYRRALELVDDDLPARWDILARQEQALYTLARWEEHDQALGEMLRLAQALNDPLYRARALRLAGRREGLSNDPRRALELLEEALHLARAGGERKLAGQILTENAQAYWRLGNAVRSQAAAEKARAIFDEIGDRKGERAALNDLANLHLGLTGDYSQALACSRESGRIAAELGDSYGAAIDMGNTALAQALLGEYRAAQKAIEESIAFVVRVGDRYSEGAFYIFQAIIQRGLGDLEQAAESTRRALELCRRVGNPNFEIESLGLLGRIALERGAPQEARQWFEQAVEVAESHAQAQDRAEQLSHLALARSRLGHHDAALRLSDESLAAMEQKPDTSDRLKLIYFERAQIAAARQDHQAALLYLERAHQALMSVAGRIGDPDLRRSFLENVAENRAIVAAHQRGYLPSPLRQETVRLPAASAPTGRPLREDEYVEVVWTLAAPEDSEIAGKAARRRRRLLRLLRQAAAQSAGATVAALSEALGVSQRTVKRDLAGLRAAGYDVQTRGSRKA